ncbi:MAG TPA: class I SAM-dependent methyltransferase [Terriglobales bacterium]|nr:class I SAM-dependent methyltransferase [Terriglobales bacterium]
MSENPVFDAVFQSWRTSVIRTACGLGVFSRLENGPLSAGALALELGCVPRLLEAVLDACVGMGLLTRAAACYRNSHLSGAYLVEGRPLYLGHILEVQARDAALWDRLLDVVRTGEVPRVRAGAAEDDPVFTMAMNDLGAHEEAETLAGAVDLSGCCTLLDVGCGSGLYAIALCRRNPRLRATLIDREQVLRTTRAMVAASGMAERIETRAADMRECDFGSERDAILLSDSLYDDHDVARRVLRAVHAALAPGGRVIVRGYYPDPGESESAFGALFRLNLLISDPARTPPTAPDVAALLAENRFVDIRRFPLTERSTCLLGNRPV